MTVLEQSHADPLTVAEGVVAVGAVTSSWWVPHFHPDIHDFLNYGGALAIVLLIVERGFRTLYWKRKLRQQREER